MSDSGRPMPDIRNQTVGLSLDERLAVVERFAGYDSFAADNADNVLRQTVRETRTELAQLTARVTALEAEKARLKLDANEQHLIDVYRQNKCGDPACEGTRFSAAQRVLTGAKTHDEHATLIYTHDYQQSEAADGE